MTRTLVMSQPCSALKQESVERAGILGKAWHPLRIAIPKAPAILPFGFEDIFLHFLFLSRFTISKF